MGFPTPIKQWLREERAGAMVKGLLNRDGFIAEYLRLPEIEKLLERHSRGTVDATDRIWRLLNLQLWGDLFFTGRREQVLEGAVPIGA